jgi:hypothetical protein
LFDIGVYTFFRPCRVAINVSRTTRPLAYYGTVYLYLKKNKLKKENDSRRSQTLLKLTLIRYQSCIDPPLPRFPLGIFS